MASKISSPVNYAMRALHHAMVRKGGRGKVALREGKELKRSRRTGKPSTSEGEARQELDQATGPHFRMPTLVDP